LRLKVLKNLRTASLNSEFTGSYIKKVYTNNQNNSFPNMQMVANA